ncbi:MAG TPA: hypothetical protein PKC30_08365 [Saprospiraceae bacterium]|nr:hypothetical protein [Saprospiraceae bacterium]
MPLSICAILTVRNELQYLEILIPYLQTQNIEVILIDHGSHEECMERYSFWMGDPIVKIESMPYNGIFSLKEQLKVKQNIISTLTHDWVIHHDADEIMEHRESGMSLHDAILQADKEGYNVLNFDEFVFLPNPDQNASGKNYYEQILRYYFFEPGKNRLNRAWKRSENFSNVYAGGHKLSGDGINVFPQNHILRHYIALSTSHAQEKYLNRNFADEELARGWHKNRININPQKLAMPVHHEKLYLLKNHTSKEFERNNPSTNHYWVWNQST